MLTLNLVEDIHRVSKRRCKGVGAMNCKPLKERHFTAELKCRGIIEKAAEILEAIIKTEVSS